MEYSQEYKDLKEQIERSNGVVTPQNYFVQVPNSFVRSLELDTNEKMMYIYLWGFGGESRAMYPGQARMMKELGWSKNKVIKILKSLEEKGGLYIINRVKKDTKEKVTNLYYLCAIDNSTGNFKKDYLNIVKQVYPDKITYV